MIKNKPFTLMAYFVCSEKQGMKTLLLVDGNSIGYANHHSSTLTANDMQTQAIYGFVKSIRTLKVLYGFDAEIIVLWDGKAKFRYDLCPEYKATREDTPKKRIEKEKYKKQIPYIKKFLKNLGITQMLSLEHEADDLAGILVEKFCNPSKCKIVLVTGDRDWLQLVRNGVDWIDLRSGERKINIKNFEEKTGYKNPIAFLHGKALQGDYSDNISGVGGIGETGALKLINKYGSVNAFWNYFEENSSEVRLLKKAELSLLKGNSKYSKEEWSDMFVFERDETMTDAQFEKEREKALKTHLKAYQGQGRYLFKRNLMLMQLIKPKPLIKDKLEITKGEFNSDALIELCRELFFSSIIKDFKNFFQPFNAK